MDFISGHIELILWGALFFSVLVNILLFRKKILPLLRKKEQKDISPQNKQKSGELLFAKEMPDPPEGSSSA